MRSDTTIVAHISADRSRVELVSIPRDLLIDRPVVHDDGRHHDPRQGRTDMFNDAFAVGWDHSHDLGTAAACTWKTVETITGVRLDGFVLLDFVGLTAMVDAIGGVPICLPKALDDELTGLHVPAGPQVFDGPTAVQFARARHDIGDGSDTQRILRQHDLMAAMARSVLSAKTLSNPVALLLVRGRSHEVADRERRVRVARRPHRARALAAARAAPTGSCSCRCPRRSSPTNKNRVGLGRPRPTTLWARIAADQPVGEAAPPVDAAAPPPTPGSTPETTAADALDTLGRRGHDRGRHRRPARETTAPRAGGPQGDPPARGAVVRRLSGRGRRRGRRRCRAKPGLALRPVVLAVEEHARARCT